MTRRVKAWAFAERLGIESDDYGRLYIFESLCQARWWSAGTKRVRVTILIPTKPKRKAKR